MYRMNPGNVLSFVANNDTDSDGYLEGYPASATQTGQLMSVLAVAAAAEIGQHVFGNWLYLGLRPTYYLATFYGAFALGQSLFTLGARDSPHG